MTKHTLDITAFRELFPFFDEERFSDEKITSYWSRACIYAKPYDNWYVAGDTLQHILYLFTAHIAYLGWLSDNGDDDGAGGIVQSATEGSVSISMATPDSVDWWEMWLAKTPYGMELLALLKALSLPGFYFGGKPENAAIRDVGGMF